MPKNSPKKSDITPAKTSKVPSLSHLSAEARATQGKSLRNKVPRSAHAHWHAGDILEMAPRHARARFAIGEVVRHRVFDFRGVVFDIDPVFANSEEWYESIPKEVRPHREQPFYHLLAENGDSSYIAYVSQQNLTEDGESGPIDHPSVTELFEDFADGWYRMRRSLTH